MAQQTDYRFPWGNLVTYWPTASLEAEAAIEEGDLIALGTAGRQVVPYDGDAGVGEPAIGVAYAPASSGNMVPVNLLGPVVLMTVGTGGATRGDWAVPSTTADEEGYIISDDGTMGTTKNACIGIVMETGEASEKVPVLICGNGIYGVN